MPRSHTFAEMISLSIVFFLINLLNVVVVVVNMQN